MQFSFTAQASQKILSVMAEKGGSLALRIEIARGPGGLEWKMTLEPRSAAAMVVDGVPVHASPGTLRQMEGLVIDWVVTPEGPGFGVFDKNRIDRDLHRG